MREVPLYGEAYQARADWLRVEGPGFRVQGSGFRVQGSGFRVRGQGSGFRGATRRAQTGCVAMRRGGVKGAAP
jgi:hypothetical protein